MSAAEYLLMAGTPVDTTVSLLRRKAPESLRPVTPYFFIDECYILYAVGLLAEIAPLKALKIVKKHLKKL